MFKKGLIKVVWVDKDPKRIYSQMFHDIKEAEQFAKSKKDYLTFQLVKQENLEHFEWEILPLGSHQLYETLLQNYLKHRSKISRFLSRLL